MSNILNTIFSIFLIAIGIFIRFRLLYLSESIYYRARFHIKVYKKSVIELLYFKRIIAYTVIITSIIGYFLTDNLLSLLLIFCMMMYIIWLEFFEEKEALKRYQPYHKYFILSEITILIFYVICGFLVKEKVLTVMIYISAFIYPIIFALRHSFFQMIRKKNIKHMEEQVSHQKKEVTFIAGSFGKTSIKNYISNLTGLASNRHESLIIEELYEDFLKTNSHSIVLEIPCFYERSFTFLHQLFEPKVILVANLMENLNLRHQKYNEEIKSIILNYQEKVIINQKINIKASHILTYDSKTVLIEKGFDAFKISVKYFNYHIEFSSRQKPQFFETDNISAAVALIAILNLKIINHESRTLIDRGYFYQEIQQTTIDFSYDISIEYFDLLINDLISDKKRKYLITKGLNGFKYDEHMQKYFLVKAHTAFNNIYLLKQKVFKKQVLNNIVYVKKIEELLQTLEKNHEDEHMIVKINS